VECIRAVLKGQHWVGQEKVSDVVQVLHRYLPPHATTRARQNFGLTPRELEVVAAVVAGYTNSEIANRVKLSEQTIKHHITNIFDKLGVSNRMELALFAVTHRLEGDA
jgi:two-component system nitrate/nitrite response regulator NarL